MCENQSGQKIYRIVVTGGPCAGKSAATNWIHSTFTRKGYTVLFVPETATELITGGVAPWTCGTNLEYQKCQIRLQMEKERIFLQAARTMPGRKILIVCDRGLMDNRAYMSATEFAQVLEEVGVTEAQMRDKYDAVFHLVSAGKGPGDFYTNDNNAARSETPDQASALDDKLLDAWTGHSYLKVIGNEWDFDEKMKHLVREIAAFLGEADVEPTGAYAREDSIRAATEDPNFKNPALAGIS